MKNRIFGDLTKNFLQRFFPDRTKLFVALRQSDGTEDDVVINDMSQLKLFVHTIHMKTFNLNESIYLGKGILIMPGYNPVLSEFIWTSFQMEDIIVIRGQETDCLYTLEI